MIKGLFRKKNVSFIRDASEHSKLAKTLGLFDLIAMGIGAIIGTGIFVLTGVHAANTAGPAVTLSFFLAGLTCIFVALVYTEIASSIPSSGGSYTYAYVAIGEIAAWMVGWLVICQFLCSCTAVAVGWSGYVVGVLKQLNIHIPDALTKNPFDGGVINLPAVLIVLLMVMVLIRGIKESTKINAILVFVKLAAIFIFIGIALPHVDFSNWSDFMPYGMNGVALGAGSLFIAYTGFDAIANAAEESKNPERDVTISIIASIAVSAVLYVIVAAVLTGIVDYKMLNNAEPLAFALKANGSNLGGAIVAAGGIAGMTTVILFQLYAGTRVLMSMSRDGLMPKVFSKIHPKFMTPHLATIIAGGSLAVLSGFMPIRMMADLSSIATLSILLSVVVSALLLRRNKPLINRPFKCPSIYVMSTLSFICCGYLIASLLQTVGLIFALWLAVGLVVYFVYTRKNATRVYNKSK